MIQKFRSIPSMDQRLPKRLSELVPRTILKDDGAASCNNCHHSDRVSSWLVNTSTLSLGMSGEKTWSRNEVCAWLQLVVGSSPVLLQIPCKSS